MASHENVILIVVFCTLGQKTSWQPEMGSCWHWKWKTLSCEQLSPSNYDNFMASQKDRHQSCFPHSHGYVYNIGNYGDRSGRWQIRWYIMITFTNIMYMHILWARGGSGIAIYMLTNLDNNNVFISSLMPSFRSVFPHWKVG